MIFCHKNYNNTSTNRTLFLDKVRLNIWNVAYWLPSKNHTSLLPIWNAAALGPIWSHLAWHCLWGWVIWNLSEWAILQFYTFCIVQCLHDIPINKIHVSNKSKFQIYLFSLFPFKHKHYSSKCSLMSRK